MACKRKQHQSGCHFRPKKKIKVNPDENVTINIGLMRMADTDLKPVWGKRLPIQVPKSASYARILSQGIDKWVAFDRKFDGEEDYVVLYEDGSHAIFLPGQEDDFRLETYKTELGRDFKRITMYLCTTADFELSQEHEDRKSETADSMCGSASISSLPHQSSEINKDLPPPKCDISSGEESGDKTSKSQQEQAQILDDAKLAEELQEIENNMRFDDVSNHSTSTGFTEPSQVVKELANRVDQGQDFFLVSRRAAPFNRTLALWQRQAQKTSPTSVLRVHFSGEAGIDTGAMSQEFLAQVMSDMGKEMFPDGSPTDSTYHVQNGNFRTCGQIVSVSLAQGGSPPCFLEQCAYESMVNRVDMVNIQEADLTTREQKLLNDVREDCKKHSDLILEHGYTGLINENRVDEIIRSFKVSLVHRRMLYMKEFLTGMALYGLADLVSNNPTACQSLFVNGSFKEQLAPDANYLFSLMNPQYSPEGSSRRQIEENIMDHFQDCLILFEDDNVKGHSAAVAWNYKDESLENECEEKSEVFETPELSVAGVMGWLTGQRHKPIDNRDFTVTVNFNHDCLIKNPSHKLCFPVVGACGKEITFPVAHMSSFSDFKELFILAFCKGQSFSKP